MPDAHCQSSTIRILNEDGKVVKETGVRGAQVASAERGQRPAILLGIPVLADTPKHRYTTSSTGVGPTCQSPGYDVL